MDICSLVGFHLEPLLGLLVHGEELLPSNSMALRGEKGEGRCGCVSCEVPQRLALACMYISDLSCSELYEESRSVKRESLGLGLGLGFDMRMDSGAGEL